MDPVPVQKIDLKSYLQNLKETLQGIVSEIDATLSSVESEASVGGAKKLRKPRKAAPKKK